MAAGSIEYQAASPLSAARKISFAKEDSVFGQLAPASLFNIPMRAKLGHHTACAQHQDAYEISYGSAKATPGWMEASVQAHLLRCQRKGPCRPSTVTKASVSAPMHPEPAVDSDARAPLCEQFCEDDFDVHPSVGIGLGGRMDEVLYEATVKSGSSALVGRRVVLRQLVGKRAQRWGQRAIEVWQKVRGGRESTLHPFMATVHGYIPAYGNHSPLVLVHAFYGSYSLHQWLLRSDWLPSLEARLSLDQDEAMRRIGDASTGGAQVSRRQRITKMLLRDALIGVNYLHSRGLAHTNLKLQTMHVSAADKRLKLSVPGSAVDLPPAQHHLARTKMMAFDVRCVGLLMARLVLRELMHPAADATFRAFLVKDYDPASLREFLLPLLASPDGPYSSPGLQLLDREGGVGWHLLSRLLAPLAGDRISAADALRHPFLCGPKWRLDSSLSMAAWMLGSCAVRITEEYCYHASQRDKLQQLVETLERLQQLDLLQAWSCHAGGEWRLLYHTGRQVGMTLRKSPVTVRIGHVLLSISLTTLSAADVRVSIDFVAMPGAEAWPLDKAGVTGRLLPSSQGVVCEAWPQGEAPGLRLRAGSMEMGLELDYRGSNTTYPQQVLAEVRRQVPPEMFDLSLLQRVTFLDGRLLIVRGAHGPGLLFTRTAKASTPAFQARAPLQLE